MAKKTEINYDTEEDILSLSKGKKVKVSKDIGDFVIDFDYEGCVSGLEILNASESLKIEPKELEKIEEATMTVTYRQKEIYISIVLKGKEKQMDIMIPLSLDFGHQDLKTEKTTFALA